jgi:hypothetical protein
MTGRCAPAAACAVSVGCADAAIVRAALLDADALRRTHLAVRTRMRRRTLRTLVHIAGVSFMPGTAAIRAVVVGDAAFRTLWRTGTSNALLGRLTSARVVRSAGHALVGTRVTHLVHRIASDAVGVRVAADLGRTVAVRRTARTDGHALPVARAGLALGAGTAHSTAGDAAMVGDQAGVATAIARTAVEVGVAIVQ